MVVLSLHPIWCRGLHRNSKIQHRVTTPYHPQSNGQVESTNKVLEAILTNIVKSHRKDWASRLPKELWDYLTTWRNTIRFTLYELVYGKNESFSIEFEIKAFKITLELGLDLTQEQQDNLNQINELDEMREEFFHQISIVQW